MPRKQRVLIHGSLVSAGIGTHLRYFLRALVAVGAEVTVAAVATDWPPAEIQSLRQLGVRFVTTPWASGSRLGKVHALTIWPWHLRRDFDVLYCHGHGRLHRYLRRYVRAGGLSIYHELVEAPQPGSLMHGEVRLFDLQIVASPIIAQEMRKVVPDKPIRSIPCLSSGAAVSEPAPRHAVEDRQLRVGYLGRLVRHKQPDWLIRQWPRLTHAGPLAGARLDVFGTDFPEEPMLKPLRTWVKEQGLEDRIALHEEYQLHELPRILSQIDMAVLPTLWEGLPIILVEAMQRGVPVVAMAAGGIGELAVENPDVEITPPADFVAFEQGMQRLAQRLRDGTIDAVRLHHWAERRYGWQALSQLWAQAILQPREFFGLDQETNSPRCDSPVTAIS